PACRVPRRPHGLPVQLGGKGVILLCREMFEQAANGQRRGTDARPESRRVEIVRLPAKRRSQAVEGTDELLDLGARGGGPPPGVAVRHGATVNVISGKPPPGLGDFWGAQVLYSSC